MTTDAQQPSLRPEDAANDAPDDIEAARAEALEAWAASGHGREVIRDADGHPVAPVPGPDDDVRQMPRFPGNGDRRSGRYSPDEFYMTDDFDDIPEEFEDYI